MKEKAIKAIVLIGLFVFLLTAVFLSHEAGNPKATKMDDYFIEKGQEETASNNIVASVVFDYRGLDTLGEATVLFAAATGVFLAIGRKKDGFG